MARALRHGRQKQGQAIQRVQAAHCHRPRLGPDLSSAITPANRPEEEAATGLAGDIEKQGLRIGELHIDRGYVKADLIDEVLARGSEVVCRPWSARAKRAFPKTAFKINVRDLTIIWPAGEVERIESVP